MNSTQNIIVWLIASSLIITPAIADENTSQSVSQAEEMTGISGSTSLTIQNANEKIIICVPETQGDYCISIFANPDRQNLDGSSIPTLNIQMQDVQMSIENAASSAQIDLGLNPKPVETAESSIELSMPIASEIQSKFSTKEEKTELELEPLW
jgi:hypothetical protein